MVQLSLYSNNPIFGKSDTSLIQMKLNILTA